VELKFTDPAEATPRNKAENFAKIPANTGSNLPPIESVPIQFMPYAPQIKTPDIEKGVAIPLDLDSPSPSLQQFEGLIEKK